MRDDGALLLDMLVAARKASAFAADLTYAQFERSELRQHAIINVLEIVGEAASRVSDATRNKHPEIPWPRIVGMRNRLVHGYFNVNLTQVWDTVKQDIPCLIPQLERLVPPETEE